MPLPEHHHLLEVLHSSYKRNQLHARVWWPEPSSQCPTLLSTGENECLSQSISRSHYHPLRPRPKRWRGGKFPRAPSTHCQRRAPLPWIFSHVLFKGHTARQGSSFLCKKRLSSMLPPAAVVTSGTCLPLPPLSHPPPSADST